MKTVRLLTATHIHALPGTVTVSDAECARLCALGVAEPVVKVAAKVAEKVEAPEPKQPKEQEEPKKRRRKAVKED